MTTLIAPPRQGTRPTRRERRAERRRLRRLDALSAQLAELPAVHDLLGRAAEVVTAGWIQGAWFTVVTSAGQRPVSAYDVNLAEDLPVVGACLVGAVVQAGGGPSAVRTQLVQRSLDLTWHTLHEDADAPVRWCPAPRMRMLSVLDLTRWNDAPWRTQDDVVGLLGAAQRTVVRQQELCRTAQAQLG